MPRKVTSRTTTRDEISRVHRIALGALGFGLTLGVVVLGLALVALPAPGAGARGTGGQETDRSPLDVAVEARHLGRHRLAIKAVLTMNDQRRALSDARVEAYVDMKEMPLAHRQGPLPMQESSEEPGTYVAQTTAPMVGNYEVMVKVRAPLPGKGTTVVPVDILSGNGS
jgi:hypothetical protein